MPETAECSDAVEKPEEEEDAVKDGSVLSKIACRAFLKAVTSFLNRNVVLFLDDLQFSDEASLDLIYSLLSDHHSRNILFILSIRDTQEGRQAIDPILEGSGFLPAQELKLGCLDIDATNDMISSLLRIDDSSKTKDLSKIVFSKTHGQPYFIVQYMEMLTRDGFIQMKSGGGDLNWDTQKIISKTNSTLNVGILLTHKIARCDESVRDVLKVAALLGFVFHRNDLQHVLANEIERREAEGIHSETFLHGITLSEQPSSIDAVLQKAVSEKFIHAIQKQHAEHQNDEDQMYAFNHDSIQHILVAMLPSGNDLIEFHWRIGWLLDDIRSECANSNERERLLFAACGHLDQASSLVRQDDGIIMVKFIELYLEASSCAKEKSAFALAAELLKTTLPFAEASWFWEEEYELAFSLHSKASSIFFSTGDVSLCKKMANCVLDNAKTLEEKLQSYSIISRSIAAEGNFDEGIEYGMQKLSDLGESVPSGKVSMPRALFLFARVHLRLRNHTDEDWLSIKQNKDPVKLGVSSLWVYLNACALLGHNGETLIFSTSRMLLRALENGWDEHLPIALSAWGVLQATMGNFDLAYRYAKLSIRVAEDLCIDSPSASCFGCAMGVAFGLPYREYLGQLIPPCRISAEVAFGSGDMYMFGVLVVSQQILSFSCSANLREFEAEIDQTTRLLADLNQSAVASWALPLWQAARDLIGMPEFVPDLWNNTTNHVFSQEFFDMAQSKGDDVLCYQTVLYQLPLACFLGKWTVLSEMLERIKLFEKGMHNVVCFKIHYLIDGIYNFEMYTRSRVRSHLVAGRKRIKDLKTLVQSGMESSAPYLTVLEAELASIDAGSNNPKKVEEARDLFDVATKMCLKDEIGYTNIAALAQIRAAQFEQRVGDNDSYVFAEHLRKAQALCFQWGADALIEDIDLRIPRDKQVISTASPLDTIGTIEISCGSTLGVSCESGPT